MIAKIIVVLLASIAIFGANAQEEPLSVAITAPEDLTNEVKQQMREAALRNLNIYRALHGAPALELDDTLNTQAQAQAQNMLSLQDPTDKSEKHKVDYWQSSFWEFEILEYEYTEGREVQTWYGQNSNSDYNYNTGALNNPDPGVETEDVVGDFTAMLWKGATKVGIGFAAGIEDIGIEGVGFYAVAQFSPKPNVEGEYVANVQAPVQAQEGGAQEEVPAA